MKFKGNAKRAGSSPDFWKNYKPHLEVSEDLKAWVLKQYYDQDTLSVYCDASISSDHSLIGVACSYISNGSIVVKQQYAQPALFGGNVSSWYAEMKGIMFALNFFEKYKGMSSNVVIYSDLVDIHRILGEEVMFKKNIELQKARKELKQLYKIKKDLHGEKLDIKYLPIEQRKFNPFYRSAHNTSRSLVKG